jgi:DNA-binding FadR family transcriptional regulator
MLMLKKANSLSLVHDVVHQIEEAILAGQYNPGDKLPSTRQLADIFEASLGTVREGLAILEQKGLVQVKKGAWGGFFIKEMGTQPMTESLEALMRHTKLSPRELFEFRATVEAGLVRLVVQRASDAQIQGFLEYGYQFKQCLHRGEAGWHELIEKEMSLRKEFMAAIDNRTYAAVLLPIHTNIIKFADRHLTGGHKEVEIACRYWDKILPAIADRNEEAAAGHTKEMIYSFMALLLKDKKRAKGSSRT